MLVSFRIDDIALNQFTNKFLYDDLDGRSDSELVSRCHSEIVTEIASALSRYAENDIAVLVDI